MDWPKPANLYELDSRLSSTSLFSEISAELKEVFYPLFHAIRLRTFEWNDVMDLAWNNLKMLIKADIKLRIPQPQEQLYFFSDAKKVYCIQAALIFQQI